MAGTTIGGCRGAANDDVAAVRPTVADKAENAVIYRPIKESIGSEARGGGGCCAPDRNRVTCTGTIPSPRRNDVWALDRRKARSSSGATISYSTPRSQGERRSVASSSKSWSYLPIGHRAFRTQESAPELPPVDREERRRDAFSTTSHRSPDYRHLISR